MIYGPGPSTRGESKGPSRGGLWTRARQESLWMLPRAVQSSADPKFPLRKKGKNGIGLKLGRKI